MPTKTYEIRHYANQAKIDRVAKSIAIQQELLLENTVWLTDFFYNNGYVPRFRESNGVRQKDAYNQVRGTFNSWLSILEQEGKRLIFYLAPEDENLRKELFTINKAHAWLRSKDFRQKDGTEYSQKAWEIIKVIFDLLQEAHPAPTVGFSPTVKMSVTNGIYVRESKKAKSFTRWISIISDTPRKPIQIPIQDNPYYENVSGKEDSTWTFQLKEDGKLRILASKTSEEVPPPIREGKPIGLDWGFKNLFATSDGRLLGLELHSYLIKQDKKITALSAKLQKLGVRLKTNQRYQQLIHATRETIKNTAGRILNMLDTEDVSEIVVENLDFRSRSYSKRLNRLLNNAGRNAVKNKLTQLEKERGITVTKVNPAYTSQECNHCHYVDKANRRGETFLCRNCGHKDHSDLNAAKNILHRRSVGRVWIWQNKQTVKSMLDMAFLESNRLKNQDGYCYLPGSNEVDKTTRDTVSLFAKPATS